MNVTLAPPAKRSVLVVDDTPENLWLMNEILKERYAVRVATNGEQALNITASDRPPDLILLDVMMPGLDGYEVCRRLKAAEGTRDIPVIFLTAKSQVDDEQHGFDLGAADYLGKPISPPILLARVKTQLTLKAAADFLKDQNAYLESEVRRRTDEVLTTQDATMVAMASLAETRDNETGNHIRRTQHYIRALAGALLKLRVHTDFITPESIDVLFKSAPLHDIGKVGIPDSILLKPGKLTPEEFEIMKAHTTIGRDTIAAAERLLPTPNSFMTCAREIAHSHQEKWDGSGYPQGLKGDAIPVPARLMAVADVYDALISRRVYKPPMPHAQAVDIIRAGRATHFDERVVDAFLGIEDAFRDIAQRFTGEDVAMSTLVTPLTPSNNAVSGRPGIAM